MTATKSMTTAQVDSRRQLTKECRKNFHPANIPAELKDHRCWVVWKFGEPKGNGKFHKPPYYPTTGTPRHSADDPSDADNLGTFDEVIAAFKTNKNYAGIGIAISSSLGIVALDFDNFVNELGAIAGDVLQLVDLTYAEFSPSQTGIRAFYKGEAEHLQGKPLEIFTKKGYVTVTGHVLKNTFDDDDFDGRLPTLEPELRHQLERMAGSRGDVKATDDDDCLASIDDDFPETPEEIDRLESALKAIPAENLARPEWLRVVLAIKSTRWDRSEDIAKGWSAKDTDRFNEDNWKSDWRSGKDKPRGVTIRSVFALAQEKGWENPRKKGTGNHIETYGDLSNGMRLARKYQGKLLYCTDINTWYGWDGIRWVVNKQELAAAKAVALEIVMETLKQDREVSSDGSRKNLSQAMIVHKNGKRLDEMLKLARSEPGMSVPNPGAFNVDPWHIGVPNGVIDLRDGTLLDADPAQRITKQAGAAFDPDAKCPRWLAFMDAVFEGDAELIGFMQRLTGYCLTGSVQEEKLFFLYGQGANGKSVFCTVLEAVLGEYSVTVGPVMLMKGGGPEADKHVYRLVGARLASANELGIHDIWDDQRVKSLTSRDKIPARAMYGNLFEFTPTHTLLIRGNHMPGIHDAGEGMRRRLVLVPFNRQFSESEREADLDRQLINEELSGILAWGVQGCVDWQSNGLRIPKKIAKLTAQYQDDADLLGGWLEGCCRREVGAETDLTVLYTSFKLHCENEGVRAPSKMVFGRQLADKGFQARKTNSRRMYNGICLLDEGGDL
ncbi:phage/plasmid primase, P4 family [Pseudomonas sp.]|uniref:phage/plasmid primase, P4 family n=1 Tax=Pseudomonas sp. TaxID=306 RepID=UPI003FD792C0